MRWGEVEGAPVRDQLVHACNEPDGAIGVASRDLGNRSRGPGHVPAPSPGT